MIPEIISKTSIESALKKILRDGVPPKRRSHDYCLVAHDRHFPPKYAISLAHEVATGEALCPKLFSGGHESEEFLHRRGFKVEGCTCGGTSLPNRTENEARSSDAQAHPMLRAAMVFPTVQTGTSNGIPPSHPTALQPVLPTADNFAGEPVDIVLFPEAYISSDDDRRKDKLERLAAELNAPLLVGAVDENQDESGRAWQVLLRFDPAPSPVYVKHSTADAVAFERQDWDPGKMLSVHELAGVNVGTTICHDHYLGLLPRHLARTGAWLWVNPSYDNVVDIKWSSILRLRAAENRFFALCTLHQNVNRRSRTHPFAFSPDGKELSARQAGSSNSRPLSRCNEAGNIYIVDLDMGETCAPRDWSRLPHATKPKRPRNGQLIRPVQVAVRDGHPSVRGPSRWKSLLTSGLAKTESGQVFVGVLEGDHILDAARCFEVLDQAERKGCAPIIWNHWTQLPTDSSRLASLMMGRSIECCAPVVISDGEGIHELVELSNQNKIPARRTEEPPGKWSGKWVVDVAYAWGRKGAFKIVSRHLRQNMQEIALNRYRSLM